MPILSATIFISLTRPILTARWIFSSSLVISAALVLLTGTIAVDRVQPWGEQLRLAETRPGDILGEMSLLDGGPRFSSCTTLTDCEIGVLSAEALDEMMVKDAALAAKLMALLARKLSFRLRAISVRLGEEQHT